MNTLCIEILHTSGYPFLLQYTPAPALLQAELPGFHLGSKRLRLADTQAMSRDQMILLPSGERWNKQEVLMEHFHRRQKRTLMQFSISVGQNIHPQMSGQYHRFSAFGFSVEWGKRGLQWKLCVVIAVMPWTVYLGFIYEKGN